MPRESTFFCLILAVYLLMPFCYPPRLEGGGRNSLIISTHNYPYITVCPSLQLIDQQIPLTVVAVLGTVLIFTLCPFRPLKQIG